LSGPDAGVRARLARVGQALRPHLGRIGLVGALLALAFLVGRCAWVSDDAYITLRTLDNFVSGHGLRYNPVERVQAFTHPLWLAWLTVPYAVTREPWLTTMAVGFATSMAAAGLVALGAARTRVSGMLALVALGCSKGFVDYATSGLEGPLLWLLLALFGLELVGGVETRDPRPPRLVVLVLLSGLVGLTRLDALLFVVPGLGYAAWRLVQQRDVSRLLLAQLAWLPLVLWHLFSLVYYGSLVPNTAWAKLGAGIASSELMAQAPWYFSWSTTYDPATLPAIGLGVLLAAYRRDLRGGMLAIGVLLYLAYIVRIGGDFMGGRFFATPLFVSALLVARNPVPRLASAGLLVALVGLSLSSRYSPLTAGRKYHRAKALHGVVDERGFYWRGTGLWVERDRLEPNHLFARSGRQRRELGPGVVNKAVIGMYGYYAGPDVHIIDRLALSEPVLARLPIDEQGGWRIGHFERRVPDGYHAHRAGLPTQVMPAPIHDLVDIVDTVTRSESLFTWERLDAIRKLHDGTVDALIRDASTTYPRIRWVSPSRQRDVVDREGIGLRHHRIAGEARLDLSPGIRRTVVARNGKALVFDRTLWGRDLTLRLPRVDRLILYAMDAEGTARWTLTPKAKPSK